MSFFFYTINDEQKLLLFSNEESAQEFVTNLDLLLTGVLEEFKSDIDNINTALANNNWGDFDLGDIYDEKALQELELAFAENNNQSLSPLEIVKILLNNINFGE